MLTSCTIEILGKNFKPSALLTPVATTEVPSLRVTLKSVANAALTQLPDATCSTWGDPKTAVAPEGNPPAALIHRNALAPLLPCSLPCHASRAAVGKPARGALAPLAVST
ncbi:hypothetical protein LC593_33165 [Nostoc sp. CHAB 5844]|nr:hypothetical protein [Nostoc sp. CHAB 5844]